MRILIDYCDKCGEKKSVVEIESSPEDINYYWYLCENCLTKLLKEAK